MKFLSILMSFVLSFNSVFHQVFAQTLQFERTPVTSIVHTALDSKAQPKGYSLSPGKSEISWIPFEREVAQAQGSPGSIGISESAYQRNIETPSSTLIIGIATTLIGIIISLVTTAVTKQRILPMREHQIASRFRTGGIIIAATGIATTFYGVLQMYLTPYSNRVFLGEFDYAMMMKDQSEEPGYCTWLVNESGYFEVTGCPEHPEILTSNQESQFLEITRPYKGVPFVVTSGTLL